VKGFRDSLLFIANDGGEDLGSEVISVKRYVVRLSADEHEQLGALIRKGRLCPMPPLIVRRDRRVVRHLWNRLPEVFKRSKNVQRILQL
jgi:hypothetical protein